jgi:hypothetical protein
MAAAARILTRAAALSRDPPPPEGECSSGSTGTDQASGSNGAEPASGNTGVQAASVTSKVRGCRIRKN